MSAKADVIEEFARSFSSSWFGVKGLVGSGVVPCILAKDRQVAKGFLAIGYMVGADGKMLSHDLKWDTERQHIIRDYPTLGALKAGPTVGYLSVKPRRQFKKGYVPENVDMYVPNAADIRKLFPRLLVSPTSKRVVWQVFNRNYWSPRDAIGLINDGEGVGYPLSAHFSVYIGDNWDSPMLLHNSTIVGAHRDGVFRLLPEYKIYREQFERETKEKIW